MSEVDVQAVFNAPRPMPPAFLVVVAIVLVLTAALIWAVVQWKEPTAADVTYRLMDLKERSQPERLAILTPFARNHRCVADGLFVERGGAKSLEFIIPDGPETDTPLGCLKRKAPDGFVFSRIGK